MKRSELMRDYWHYYRNLENKLIATSSYIEIHGDNFTAFSNEYALLLQSTGAELDNFFKVFCGYNSTDRKNINDYAGYILSSYPDVVNQIVTILDRGIDLQPFAGWNTSAPAQSLNWWISFDEVKHNRAGNIKKANQENVLNMMAALYLLEMKYLGTIAAQDASGQLTEPDVPDDQSKLFDLKGWNFRYVPLGSAFAVVDGEVYEL